MQRLYQELEGGMHLGNKPYDELCMRLGEFGKANPTIKKTLYWQWLVEMGEDLPELLFHNTPPIGEARESDRILITGTKVETGDMYTILRGMEVYQRVMKEISRRRKWLPQGITQLPAPYVAPPGTELAVAVAAVQQQEGAPEFSFSGRVASFWENFFGQDDFLDSLDKVSVPRAIIGTGKMRNYNKYGGETLFVDDRLKEISNAWGIPIQIIESWAP